MHKKSVVYTQKDLLCIHKRSLVHAQHSRACSGPGNPGARDPKRQLGRSQALDRCLFGSLAPGVPGPGHAQECCACTRDLLCIHNRSFCVYTSDFLCMNHYQSSLIIINHNQSSLILINHYQSSSITINHY